jgi:hypothetical protein
MLCILNGLVTKGGDWWAGTTVVKDGRFDSYIPDKFPGIDIADGEETGIWRDSITNIYAGIEKEIE